MPDWLDETAGVGGTTMSGRSGTPTWTKRPKASPLALARSGRGAGCASMHSWTSSEVLLPPATVATSHRTQPRLGSTRKVTVTDPSAPGARSPRFQRTVCAPAGVLGEALPFFIGMVSVTSFVFGVAYAFITVPAMTLLQEQLREDIRGRVFGVLNMLVSIFSFLPLIFVGPMADVWGVAPVFVLAAVAVFGVWLGGRRVRMRSGGPSTPASEHPVG